MRWFAFQPTDLGRQPVALAEHTRITRTTWPALPAVAVLLAALAACAPLPPGPAAPRLATGPTDCQIVFDAGSSGTRLYLYAKAPNGWVEHAGPRTVALADPVRQIRGKTHADIEAVTQDVVAQLDRMRQAGPTGSDGKPAWAAFDWTQPCRITDAMVLATAGMRIAEQEDPQRSRQLWASLERRLRERLGPGPQVKARTLTGFEEGLFAWLAVREARADARFGIAEMGGASSQVTFPCPGCDANDDAVRTVVVKGQPIRMYSYSFLGLGQDEAPQTLRMPASCAYGVALTQPGWQPADCASRIDLGDARGLPDPYNMALPTAPGRTRGTQRHIPTAQADVQGWVLTGAFNYLAPDAMDSCCRSQGQCFQAESACFRVNYLDKYLARLGIAPSAPKMDVSWTQGAVLCTESRCLREAAPPVCRWSASGCL